jgi:hypothetical protein
MDENLPKLLKIDADGLDADGLTSTAKIDYVRADMEKHDELYVILCHEDLETSPESLHTSKASAEERAAYLAKQLGCEWGTNYPDDPA